MTIIRYARRAAAHKYEMWGLLRADTSRALRVRVEGIILWVHVCLHVLCMHSWRAGLYTSVENSQFMQSNVFFREFERRAICKAMLAMKAVCSSDVDDIGGVVCSSLLCCGCGFCMCLYAACAMIRLVLLKHGSWKWFVFCAFLCFAIHDVWLRDVVHGMEVICVVCSSLLRDVNNNEPSVLLFKHSTQDLGLHPHQKHDDAANGSNWKMGRIFF